MEQFPHLTPRERMVEQARLRDRLQAGIYELIQEYEAKTGVSVVRVEYDANERRVMVEALPL